MTDTHDVQAAFIRACDDAQTLPERPGPLTLLRLYALFKQGSQGDALGPRPGLTDVVARAKFDAWAACSGTPRVDAMRHYIELVRELQG